jgi:hypothetical protein
MVVGNTLVQASFKHVVGVAATLQYDPAAL